MIHDYWAVLLLFLIPIGGRARILRGLAAHNYWRYALFYCDYDIHNMAE